MRAFVVKAGTEVKVIAKGKEWDSRNFEDQTTTEEQVFFLEDMRIDPLGIHGPPLKGVTVGSAWADAGWYGFELENGDTMMVPGDLVEVY
jgi:hypothetical protein